MLYVIYISTKIRGEKVKEKGQYSGYTNAHTVWWLTEAFLKIKVFAKDALQWAKAEKRAFQGESEGEVLRVQK